MDDKDYRVAFQQARITPEERKKWADIFGDFVSRNMRHVDRYTLARMKRALRKYDLRTCEWKD